MHIKDRICDSWVTIPCLWCAAEHSGASCHSWSCASFLVVIVGLVHSPKRARVAPRTAELHGPAHASRIRRAAALIRSPRRFADGTIEPKRNANQTPCGDYRARLSRTPPWLLVRHAPRSVSRRRRRRAHRFYGACGGPLIRSPRRFADGDDRTKAEHESSPLG
jgi:hypothetical protein